MLDLGVLELGLIKGASGPTSTAEFVGLSSNAFYTDFAENFSQAGISATVDGVPNTPMNWGTSYGDTTFGALAVNPSAFDSADTGNPLAPARLYAEDPVTGARASVVIRSTLPVSTFDPALATTGSTNGSQVSLTPGTWTGIPTMSERRVSILADAVERTFNIGQATLLYTLVPADGDATMTGTDAITCSGGVVSVPATGSFVVDPFIVAAIAFQALGDQNGRGGTVPLGYTIDRDEDHNDFVTYLDGTANPTAAQILAPSGPYASAGTVGLLTTGKQIAVTSTGTYVNGDTVRIAALPHGGGDGDVAVSPAFVVYPEIALTLSLSGDRQLSLSGDRQLAITV